MCRWMAYSGSQIFLDTVLFEADNSLVDQSLNARWSHVVTNGDGFGIGWYGERGTPGLYRRKKGTTDSETIFYLLLANGKEDDPGAAYAATVRMVEDAMNE